MFMGDGNGIWLFGWFIMLLCALGLAGFIYLIIWLAGKQGKGSSKDKADPMDIVKERYPRGEITKEEFEKIKKDLS